MGILNTKFEQDPYFQNITQNNVDMAPRYQHVEDAGFVVEDGKIAMAINERLIGIPNMIEWDTAENIMKVILIDGSVVAVKSPVPANEADDFRQFNRIRLATRWNSQEMIVHQVPFTIL